MGKVKGGDWEKQIEMKEFRPEEFMRMVTGITGVQMRIEYIREMKRSYMTVTGEGVGKAMKPACWLKTRSPVF